MVDRRRRQFSLLALIAIVTIVAILFGIVAFFRTEPSEIRRVRSLGGTVRSSYKSDVEWAKPYGFVRLCSVSWIIVDNDDLSDEDLRSLVSCASLERLDISSNQVTDEGMQYISQMPELTDLGLNCVNISDEGLACLATMKNLFGLEVSGSSKVQGAFLEQFAEERPFFEYEGSKEYGPRRMSSLKLHGPAIGDSICQWLSKFERIRFLDLSNTQITDKGLLMLQPEKPLKMETLIVKDSRVTKEGVRSFRAARPNMTILGPR